jgi:hypothetical protein
MPDSVQLEFCSVVLTKMAEVELTAGEIQQFASSLVEVAAHRSVYQGHMHQLHTVLNSLPVVVGGQLYPALEAMHRDPRLRVGSGRLLLVALQLAGIASPRPPSPMSEGSSEWEDVDGVASVGSGSYHSAAVAVEGVEVGEGGQEGSADVVGAAAAGVAADGAAGAVDGDDGGAGAESGAVAMVEETVPGPENAI